MEPKITLSNQPKIATGFKVPEGYFDTFPEELSALLPPSETKVVRFPSFKKRWYFAAASMIVGLISLTFYHYYSDTTQEIDGVVLESYLANHVTLNEDDLVNLLDEKDLEKMKLNLNLADEDLKEALDNTSNIEQYLLD